MNDEDFARAWLISQSVLVTRMILSMRIGSLLEKQVVLHTGSERSHLGGLNNTKKVLMSITNQPAHNNAKSKRAHLRQQSSVQRSS